MTCKEFRKIASQFSKEELIDAVCSNISVWDMGQIALSMQQKKQNRIMHDLEMAGNAATDALNDYCEWVKTWRPNTETAAGFALATFLQTIGQTGFLSLIAKTKLKLEKANCKASLIDLWIVRRLRAMANKYNEREYERRLELGLLESRNANPALGYPFVDMKYID